LNNKIFSDIVYTGGKPTSTKSIFDLGPKERFAMIKEVNREPRNISIKRTQQNLTRKLSRKFSFSKTEQSRGNPRKREKKTTTLEIDQVKERAALGRSGPKFAIPDETKDTGILVYYIFAFATFVCCFCMPKIIINFIAPYFMTPEEYRFYTERFDIPT